MLFFILNIIKKSFNYLKTIKLLKKILQFVKEIKAFILFASLNFISNIIE